MKALMTGIYNLFNTSNTFKTAIGSRFYYEQAPEQTIFPYCVYFLLPFDNDFTFKKGIVFKDGMLQINIYSNLSSPSESTDLMDYCDTLFDSASISITGYNLITCDNNLTINPRWVSENNMWQSTLRYRIWFYK
jgi:hypothetical protein